jgi:hypothetical protein
MPELQRTAHDEINLSESVGRVVTRRRRPIHRGYLVALALFIVVPPLIFAMVGASIPEAAAIVAGIALNLVGAYVGYRAVSERVEIDRG